MADFPGKSLAEWARLLDWRIPSGPAKYRAERSIKRLVKAKLAKFGGGRHYQLTDEGKREAKQVTLVLHPHVEERGSDRFHLDRFDSYLDGVLLLTSRQPWYDGARELLRRGYPDDTLLTIRHAGKDHDSFVPRSIGYLAQWSISDSTRGRLKPIRWQPMPQQISGAEATIAMAPVSRASSCAMLAA